MIGAHIQFKQNLTQTPQTYTVKDILAYGSGENYLRQRFTVETDNGIGDTDIEILFLSCLIKGTISLYQNKEGKNGRDLFVYTSDRGIKAVESKKEIVYVDNKMYKTPGLQYKSVLTAVMGECYDPNELLEKFGYSRKRIVKTVIDYHTCVNEPYQLMEESKEETTQTFIGFVPAYGALGIKNGLPDDGVGIGLIYIRSLFKSPTIFLQIETSYLPDNSLLNSSLNQSERSQSILLRPSVRKSIKFKRAYLFANAGIHIRLSKGKTLVADKWTYTSLEGPVFVGLGYGYNIHSRIRVEAFGSSSSTLYLYSGLNFLLRV